MAYSSIISTSHLSKKYGSVLRVNDLDLRVPEGCIYGFLGPNGAGKSTTLKMILGLVRPTAGDIAVFGEPMMRRNRLAILKQVGSLIEARAITAIFLARKICALCRRCAACRRKTSARCWRSCG